MANQFLTTQTGDLYNSVIVGAIATGVDNMYYRSGNDMTTVFAASAASEFFSENLDQMVISQFLPGQSMITQPVSSGILYFAAGQFLQHDKKSPMFQFLQQVGSSIAGKYVSPMLTGGTAPVAY